MVYPRHLPDNEEQLHDLSSYLPLFNYETRGAVTHTRGTRAAPHAHTHGGPAHYNTLTAQQGEPHARTHAHTHTTHLLSVFSRTHATAGTQTAWRTCRPSVCVLWYVKSAKHKINGIKPGMKLQREMEEPVVCSRRGVENCDPTAPSRYDESVFPQVLFLEPSQPITKANKIEAKVNVAGSLACASSHPALRH